MKKWVSIVFSVYLLMASSPFFAAAKQDVNVRVGTKTGAKAAEKAVKGFSKNSFKAINSQLLSQNGIKDIHKFKQGFLGKNAILKHFDVVKHTQSGELLIIRKSTQEIISYTGKFIK